MRWANMAAGLAAQTFGPAVLARHDLIADFDDAHGEAPQA